MSVLEPTLSSATCDIEELAHSMAVLRNEARRPRPSRMRVQSANPPDDQETEQDHHRFVDHTDSLEQVRSAQREIVGTGEVPAGGGPENIPGPYYASNP